MLEVAGPVSPWTPRDTAVLCLALGVFGLGVAAGLSWGYTHPQDACHLCEQAGRVCTVIPRFVGMTGP